MTFWLVSRVSMACDLGLGTFKGSAEAPSDPLERPDGKNSTARILWGRKGSSRSVHDLRGCLSTLNHLQASSMTLADPELSAKTACNKS